MSIEYESVGRKRQRSEGAEEPFMEEEAQAPKVIKHDIRPSEEEVKLHDVTYRSLIVGQEL